eukprot:scaffold123031_cov60-Phaeocystis_antarctica.AAC.2
MCIRDRYCTQWALHRCISLSEQTRPDTLSRRVLLHAGCEPLLLDALGVSWTLPERGGARDEHPGQGEGDHKERNVHLSVGSEEGGCEGEGVRGRRWRNTTSTPPVRGAGKAHTLVEARGAREGGGGLVEVAEQPVGPALHEGVAQSEEEVDEARGDDRAEVAHVQGLDVLRRQPLGGEDVLGGAPLRGRAAGTLAVVDVVGILDVRARDP